MEEAWIASQEMQNKSKTVTDTYNSIAELQADMRKSSVDFFNRISLLSGGIISLSITYLGYLSTNHGRIVFTELLFISWILLLIALFAGLYRNHFNLIMGHWQTLIQLNNARLEQQKALLAMLNVAPNSIANIKPHEVGEQKKKTQKAIKNLTDGGRDIEKDEQKYNRLWTISQKLAHICFASGVVVTVIFAGLNVPVATEFTILNSIQSIVSKY